MGLLVMERLDEDFLPTWRYLENPSIKRKGTFWEVRLRWSPRNSGELPLGGKTGLLWGEMDFSQKEEEKVEGEP